ncbi:hypothetical protein [Streptomyces sp. bgisy100]|uniref:hypothetical protein n=1 Tax=Streptomyces sp. bgisy100 TaxID=3413783 RepID=UPI003D738C54
MASASAPGTAAFATSTAAVGPALRPAVAPEARSPKKRAPAVTVSKKKAGAGGSITVRGTGWRPKALLTLLICGQNMIGGTNACANADGRAVTARSDGTFRRELPVSEPPKPCPCVVHAATVEGEAASADAAFAVAGHPVKPLPREGGTGRLTVLDARLDGSSGLLTWFGAPPQRRLVLTVGNVGSAAVRNPVFRVGTSHGVFAPAWEEQQWRGTVPAGRRARIDLPVELSAGAHGDYLVSLKYGDTVLTEQPWGVGRPWGVTLFWLLLCVVVPAAVFRIGMAVVDRVRPRAPARTGRHRTRRPGGPAPPRRGGRPSAGQPPGFGRSRTGRPRTGEPSAGKQRAGEQSGRDRAGDGGAGDLPWFSPDTLPGSPTPVSAPSDDPSTKGNT